jgi:hypothetical protein
MMPVKVVSCTINGQSGFKASEGGKCYTGPAAREKAVAHVQAINIATARKKGEKWAKKLK